MTVEEMKRWLATFPDNLEIVVRAKWYPDGVGGAPATEIFTPCVLLQDIDHDTAEEFVALECDQDED